jgi:hypothetical protein
MSSRYCDIMQADAGTTSPSPQRTDSKRTKLIATLIVAGMLLFAIIQSLHGSQPPDSERPLVVERGSAPVSASAPDAVPASSAGAAAPIRFGSLTFFGYACTLNCSGHEAGYHWGKIEGITRPGNCPNAPQYWHSFTEGCWAEAGRQGP